MEDIQIQVESVIRSCNIDELCKVAQGIKVDESEWRDQSKTAVMRAIGSLIESMPDDGQKRAVMMQMLAYLPERVATRIMTILVSRPGDDADDKSNISIAQEKRESMQDTLLLLKTLGIDAESHSNRREFKINGVIGSTTKDSLNYISLCSQIADGKKKKYKEDDICIAIRKAVTPGSNLRTYLDSKSDMSLESMVSFIRSAMKEKSSTELFQDLNNAAQTDSEDAQQFVLRAMELRQKVVMASEAEGSIRYDANLVQSLFMHTVRTGLQDNAIKARIEPLIKTSAATSDDLLIKELNLITSEEEERKVKIGVVPNRKKVVNVAEVTTGPVATDALLNTVLQLGEQLKTLQRDMDSLKANSGKGTRKPSTRRGCEHCAKAGTGATCRHCFRCGAGDHLMSQCKKSPKC